MDWVDRLQQAVDAKGKRIAVAMEAGIDESALSDILRRKSADPHLFTVFRVCQVCNVTLGWVMGEKGFELGDDDFRRLGELTDWAKTKIDERAQRGLVALPQPKAPKRKSGRALPAVATPRGELWDDGELRDREIPREYQNEGANAVFVTRGESMTGAGIFANDILFVKKTKNHRIANGRIVVCRLDGTFTVKRLNIETGVITLISENESDPPVTINEEAERFELIGFVVGIARDLVRSRP